ncbi:MAG: (d)CMP kinase, partial [Oscillospiraceae bacterium]|nr:(d)CMP kinase [Oscillospiraceae bacterium]
MKEQPIAVAIDGPSGAGKSSIARAAAGRLGFVYVDTGAIYRTVGLASRRAGLDLGDAGGVAALLPSLHIELSYDSAGAQAMLLDGEDVSAAIRAPEISMCASSVAALPVVRAFLLEMQRDMARRYDVIMDGRDIGTVVLPDAKVKIFLTASPEARARRRCLELEQTGVHTGFDEVLRDILFRDRQDSERAAAPLKRAEDAVTVDTSELDFDASVAAVCR